MAQSKRRKPKKDRKKSGATGSRNPQMKHARSPKTTLRPFIKIVNDVATSAEQTLLATPNSSQQLVRFDTQVLMRGLNSLKAVRVLLEQGYWEYGVVVSRQLFELLVNVEYLGKMPDREEATLQFARYGLLQFLRAEQRKIAYDEEKSRPVNAEHKAMVEQHLDQDFMDFRSNTKDGSVGWVNSWCRKDTAALAKESADSMRVYQYDMLYRVWSEQTHAAPGALIKDIFRDTSPGWVEQTVAENESWSKETFAFAIQFFLALWLHLPHVARPVGQIHQWLSDLNAAMGGPALSAPAVAGSE